MNDEQKLLVMIGTGSFMVFLITIFGLGFSPYTVYYSKGYKSDPLMYLFDTKMREMVEREVKYQYDSYKNDKDYRVKHYYKYLDDGEILSQNQRNISTSCENELSLNHKQLEHQRVFKDLVNFLN